MAYDAAFFQHYTGGAYTRDNPHWGRFFGGLAQFIADFIRPTLAIEVGCAIGILLDALQSRGISATGFDISEYAVSQCRAGIAWVGDVADAAAYPQGVRADLVICLEVLEHIPPERTATALDNLCNAGDALLFSSTPHDTTEPTHCNVHPVGFWIAEFARRGFTRKPLLEPAGLIPWGLYFERA